jgi:hypothetical protein
MNPEFWGKVTGDLLLVLIALVLSRKIPQWTARRHERKRQRELARIAKSLGVKL